jgi:hypothetical protein
MEQRYDRRRSQSLNAASPQLFVSREMSTVILLRV